MMLNTLRRNVVRRCFHSRALLFADKNHTTAASSSTTNTTSDDITTSGFNWQSLVTPLSPPEFTSRMRSIDNQLSTMRQELIGVPDEIEPINWNEWEQKIEDKAAFQQIKSQYEGLDIQPQKGQDLREQLNQIDTGIAKIKETEELVRSDLTKYQHELELAIKEKEEIHRWHYHDFLNRYPGLAEQNREQYMQGYQLPSDAEDRLADTDMGEVRKQVKATGRLIIDPEVPTKIGSFDAEVELMKTAAFAKKVFGDSPKWPEMQKEIDREIAETRGDQHEQHAEGTGKDKHH